MTNDDLVFEDGELIELQRRMAADPVFRRRAREVLARQSFRAPCAEDEGASLLIDGASFPVVNFGSRGVGFLTENEEQFVHGMELVAVELVLDEHRFRFSGRVVHVSPAEDDRWLVGVEITDLAEDEVEAIHALVLDRRRRLFAAGA